MSFHKKVNLRVLGQDQLEQQTPTPHLVPRPRQLSVLGDTQGAEAAHVSQWLAHASDLDREQSSLPVLRQGNLSICTVVLKQGLPCTLSQKLKSWQ